MRCMEMSKLLLTLAIKEMKPKSNKFLVVVLELNENKIVSIPLKREEIVDQQGTVYWDIGFLTSVEDYRVHNEYGEEQLEIIGRPELRKNRINDLKGNFEKRAEKAQEFFLNPNSKYAIAKVKRVTQIYERNERNYLKVDFTHIVPAIGTGVELLCKDYKWVKYWTWVNKQGKTEEAINRYMNLLNSRNKDLYVLLYRHKFKDGRQMYWVSGMHWL